jgi:hypothetical protein
MIKADSWLQLFCAMIARTAKRMDFEARLAYSPGLLDVLAAERVGARRVEVETGVHFAFKRERNGQDGTDSLRPGG